MADSDKRPANGAPGSTPENNINSGFNGDSTITPGSSAGSDPRRATIAPSSSRRWQSPSTASATPQPTNNRATQMPGRSFGSQGTQGPKGPDSPEPPKRGNSGKANKNLMYIIAALIVVLIAVVTWFIVSTISQKQEIEEARALQAQAELDANQRELQNAYNELNEEFSQLENQRQLILDDSVKRDLQEKYDAARLQVEKLQQQLRTQRNMSNAEINKLKDEIASLRKLLKHYVEEINRLQLENQTLRTENAEIKDRNQQLSSRVEETSRANEELAERMTLAEKLNITGLNLTALNKKGKTEKKIAKARQLCVTFTIPQNNSTPVGAKTIYLRIVAPSGQLLPGGGSFTFEDATLDATAKKVIEYAGEEIGGVTIYWDVNMALSAGQYTVELFADNFRLISKHFELK